MQDTLPEVTPRLTPPHRDRKSWDEYCRYCEAQPGDPCRTKTGRPYVMAPDGTVGTYTRVSTLAKAVDDTTNLTKWKVRTTAVGLLRRPGLMTRMSGVLANATPDAAKRDLDRICEDAFEAGGGSDKADAGTGLHALSEALDRGDRLEWVSESDRARLDAYRAAMAGYTPVRAEGFVVCDELRTAGSYDRLWLCPDGRVRVGDLKSGAWEDRYPLGVTTQLAQYSRSQHYDPETGVRTPLDDRLDPSTGLLIHMPAETGGCTVIPLNLDRGWAVAQVAARVRDIRSWKAEDFRAVVA